MLLLLFDGDNKRCVGFFSTLWWPIISFELWIITRLTLFLGKKFVRQKCHLSCSLSFFVVPGLNGRNLFKKIFLKSSLPLYSCFLACKLKCRPFCQVSSLCEIFWSTVWTLWVFLNLIWFYQPKKLAMEHSQPRQFDDINMCSLYWYTCKGTLFLQNGNAFRWLLSPERSLSWCYSSNMDGVCTLNFSSQMLPWNLSWAIFCITLFKILQIL